MVRYLPLNLAVSEGGLKAENGLKINTLLRNWHIINHTSHYYELPLYRGKFSVTNDVLAAETGLKIDILCPMCIPFTFLIQ